jgi:hypothetical protein
MTPKFKAALTAGFWFAAGFITHFVLMYFHRHP